MKRIDSLRFDDRELNKKIDGLAAILRDMKSLVVAFSGGVDSTFLLKAAWDILGGNVLAVIARSETYPEGEYRDALAFAAEIDAPFLVIDTGELKNENFSSNPPDRCYYCKSELFCKLTEIARERGLAFVADGSNLDDTEDFRPGTRASREIGVRSPLKEAGFTKDDIRRVSRELGLSSWDKPSQACLSSRFPYGTEITQERLDMISLAEEFLAGLGLRCCRVRYHGDIARIEVPAADMQMFIDPELAGRIYGRFNEIGFTYVTLDIKGYRTGSMNEVLPDSVKDIRSA